MRESIEKYWSYIIEIFYCILVTGYLFRLSALNRELEEFGRPTLENAREMVAHNEFAPIVFLALAFILAIAGGLLAYFRLKWVSERGFYGSDTDEKIVAGVAVVLVFGLLVLIVTNIWPVVIVVAVAALASLMKVLEGSGSD